MFWAWLLRIYELRVSHTERKYSPHTFVSFHSAVGSTLDIVTRGPAFDLAIRHILSVFLYFL
jgi:hypothetical protein